MFYIVETEEKLSKIKNSSKSVFVDLIVSSENYHPKLSRVLGFYVRPLESNQGYILGVDHPDCLGFGLSTIKEFLRSFEEVLVLDKKRFLYYLYLENIIDLQIVRSLNGYGRFDQYPVNKTIDWYYSKFYNDSSIGKIIPITLHYEVKEKLFFKLQDTLELDRTLDNLSFLNDTATKVFYLIEQNGLNVKNNAFNDLYNLDYSEFNSDNNEYYGYYNLYNSTTRPTNSFNSINFLAIPHKNEYREQIVPKNDKFVEFDFDGYHLRLLCDLAGIELSEESAHKQFAKYYFNKEEISEEEYKQAKQINFQIIYSKIPEEYLKFSLFKGINNFIESLWSRYKEDGKVFIPISYKQLQRIDNESPQKLVNYYLQGYETARNITVLKDILKLLNSRKSFISLYTYDSILIDYSDEDGEEILEEIKSLMNKENKFPVKYKTSSNMVF